MEFCDKGSGLDLEIMLFIASLAFTEYFILFIVCIDASQMEKLQEVLILEDDVDFESNFRDDLEQVLEEAHAQSSTTASGTSCQSNAG